MTVQLKDWLGDELTRNKENGELYVALMKRAVGKLAPGCRVDVLIGHHLTFELDGDIKTENEVPSADCLMFDHDLMTAAFGEAALGIMKDLSQLPCGKRDDFLREVLYLTEQEEGWAAA